jgi:secreted trypsin-like serine protease
LVVLSFVLAAHAHADPTIGALVDPDHRAFCTGTLVARDVVLTAAHCVVRDGIIKVPFAFYVGDDLRLGGTFARVVTLAVHAEYDAFLHANDFAVLRIVGVAAMESAALAANVPAVGDELRAVGFGNDAVEARVLATRVTARTETAFRYTPGTCPGDSGGPLLVAETRELAAVVSTGATGCSDARAVAVAPVRTWIATASEVVNPTRCRGGDGVCAGGCTRGDPDCACIADDGACSLCAGVDVDCASACEADGVCATPCLAPDPDCGTRADSSACERDVECESSLCINGFCRSSCEAASCAPWDECIERTRANGESLAVCMPPLVVTGGCTTTEPTTSALLALALLLILGSRNTNHWRRNRT